MIYHTPEERKQAKQDSRLLSELNAKYQDPLGPWLEAWRGLQFDGKPDPQTPDWNFAGVDQPKRYDKAVKITRLLMDSHMSRINQIAGKSESMESE